MSRTETHTGSFKLHSTATKRWISDYLLNRHSYLELNDGDGWNNQCMDVIRDTSNGDIRYVYKDGCLYEMIKHSEFGDDGIFHTQQNGDGTIDFVYQFYNGGACFEEVLEEAIEQLK